jgi:hypothetical protein
MPQIPLPMKKLICILVFVFSIAVCAQQPWYKSSPLDYMWQNVGNAGFSAGGANYTCLAFSPSDGQPYVAYEDSVNSGKLTVMRFDGNNWVIVGNKGFSGGNALYINLVFSPSDHEPYVAYCDADTWRTSVMKFNDTSWVYVGNEGFTAGEAFFTSLAFAPGGQPYVAYTNGDSGTVMRFDGNNWIMVGKGGFSSYESDYISLAFSPSGKPFIAFQDPLYFSSVSLMYLNGTLWYYTGPPGFTQEAARFINLAFSPSGIPYVAYQDYGESEAIYVAKLVNNIWYGVGGGHSASEGVALYTSFAISPSDSQLYVAFQDCENSRKATLMKYDGTSWGSIGLPDFSAGEADFTSVALSPSGKPFVAYVDGKNSYKATVMKYDTAFGGINEKKESMLSIYPNPAKKNITVHLSGAIKKSNLSIVNAQGQELIIRQITESKTQIDISNLPGGVYIVQLTNDNTVELGKFVKE